MSAQKVTIAILLFSVLYTTSSFSQSLTLLKTVDAISIPSGLEFTYVLEFRCAGTDNNCENVIITDTIPDGLEFVSFTPNPNYSSNTDYDPITRIITFELNAETGTGLGAGSTGEVLLRVRFPNGSTPNSTLVQNYAFITADNATTAPSDTVETTAIASPPWQIQKTNQDGNNIFLDAPFTYQIDVSDATSGAAGSLNLDTFTIVDQLPVGAVFVSASHGGTHQAGTVTWGFGALEINNNQSVTVTLTYPSSNFNAGDMVTNSVDLFGQPVGEPYGLLDSDNITGTLQAPNPVGEIQKTVDGATAYAIGDSLNYNIEVSNTGSTALDTFFFVDTIPVELALYQIETGAYNEVPNGLTIRYQTNQNTTWQTWAGSPFLGTSSEVLNVSDLGLAGGEYINLVEYNFGSVPFDFRATNDADFHTYVLNPDQNGQAVISGITVTNCGNLTYNFATTDYFAQDCVDINTRDTLPPSVTMNKGIDSEDINVPIGGELNYFLDPFNSGDFPMDSIIMIDTIPVQMDLVFTESGGWENISTPVEVYYQTNLNTNFRAWTGSPYAVNSDSQLYESSLSLAANEYVNIVKWVFRNPQRGFVNNGDRPRIRGTLLEVDRNGNPVNIGDNIENCAYLGGYIDGTAYLHNDCETATAEPAIVAGDPDKQFVNEASTHDAGLLFRGDTITYVIEVEAHSSSTDTLINPILMDLLSPDLTYIPGSWAIRENNDNQPSPNFEVLPNYNNTSQTLLRWSWTDTAAANFAPGDAVQIEFKVVVSDAVVAEQIIENTVYQTTNDSDNFSCDESFILDFFDLDGDDSTVDIFCQDDNTTQFTIQTVASLKSEKLVKGACDTVYTKFPDVGRTVPGGEANYRIRVENIGTVPMTQVQLIDILPFEGDRGVIDLSNRNTRWRPNLIAPLEVPAGVSVYYSTASNPCRSAEGIEPSGPAGCETPNWTTIPPSDITTVQSFKIDFGDMVVQPGDELSIDWDMRAPVNTLDTIGVTADTIAWNSFGYIATRVEADGSLGNTLLAAEPFKVGISLKPPSKGSYGNFVWNDTNRDGIQDINEPGVNGVRVELYMDDGDGLNNPATDSLINYTLTTGGGLYIFSELDTADYYAVFYAPPTYVTSPPNVGLDSLDSDGIDTLFNDVPVAVTAITSLGQDERDLTWDLGIFQSDIAAVGNYVWFDENENGLQDEPATNGVNNITVTLFNSGGTPIDTTLTSNDIHGTSGYYLFDSIPPGDYYIEFDIPNSFQVTLAQQEGTGSDPTDSDAILTADTTLARTETFTLVANQFDPNWDAGLILPSGNMSLGNFVWIDSDNSGDYQPASESGINGIKINLYEDSDNNGIFTPNIDTYLKTTNTQTSGGKAGYYVFDELAAGTYIVQIDETNFNNNSPLSNHSSSTGNGIAPDPDNDLNFDDNGEPLDGYGVVSQAITLVVDSEPVNDEDGDANSNLTVDFGFYPGEDCGIFIDELALTNCDENNGNPQFDLNFNVIWLNAPTPQEDIQLSLNGTTLNPITIATPESNGQQSYSLPIAADGTTSDLQVYFENNNLCGDTASISTTLGCPLKMIKTADTLAAAVGDTITYTYAVINNSGEDMSLSDIMDDKIGTIETIGGSAVSLRTTDELQALYRFQDGAGTTVSDVSGVGAPLDLTIEGVDYTWVADTLVFTDENRASNTTENNKIYTNAILSNEITVEAWITPATTAQSGPARIVTFSEDGSNRNFSLMQRNNDYEVRLATTTNDNNGDNITARSGPVSDTSPDHVVFTRDAAGNAILYVNNVAVDTETIGGDFGNWGANYDFGIGNEFGGAHNNGSRDWQGEFHLVAVYTKALSAAEINQNYITGLIPPPTITVLPPNDTLYFTADYEVLASDLPGPVINEATIEGEYGPFGNRSRTNAMDTAAVKIACTDLTITQNTQNACENNQTGAITTDDFFTVTVNATTTGANAQYEVVRNLGEADELILATANYGTAVTVGTSGELAADGQTVYTITIRDSADINCQESFMTIVVEPCSSCPTMICLPVQVNRK